MNLSDLKEELDRDSVVCPHCQSRYRLIDGEWSTAIKKHGSLCNCPENWFCAICNELVLTIEDFKEYEKNGWHVACGEKEMADPFRCETHQFVRLDDDPRFSGFCDNCGAEFQFVDGVEERARISIGIPAGQEDKALRTIVSGRMMMGWLTDFAQAEIQRQTPAIIRTFIIDVIELSEKRYDKRQEDIDKGYFDRWAMHQVLERVKKNAADTQQGQNLSHPCPNRKVILK